MKMVKISIFLLLLITSNAIHAKVNIFACEPEWAALMKELTGEHGKVFSATTAFQDPHRIEARPSLIAKMRRADVVVCSGSELEVGWLPLLIRSSGNRKVQTNQPGYIETSQLVERLGIPTNIDRSMGDVHAAGNPHVHLDPRRMVKIAKNVGERLAKIDPDNAAHYQAKTGDFMARLEKKIKDWQALASPLNNAKAVVHHKDWKYLFDWLGIKEVATLEPKPGVPPSPGHLASLKRQMQTEPADFILRAAYQDDNAASWLEKQTGIKSIELPFTVGGSDKATDLFSLMDDTINRLLAALKK
ncbi:metal ABC transporter substrate-binding protein [Kaarinaea lacus]